MKNNPDLSSSGYEINRELGRNREGGRITWLGNSLRAKKTVVIKQFCFAVANSTWSGYKAYEQEIKILKSLKHPNIPEYLDSIETKDGFCLIQEYIAALNMNSFRQLTQGEIKQIALKLLNILVYLQQQSPPILHRDIKPDNILIDEELNVYLIDFGFASLGSLEVSGSSVFKGTPGFIAPEQIVKPVLASDVYSLGITLVCLLSKKTIAEVSAFTTPDNPYQLVVKPLLPNVDRQLSNWLQKMTNAKVSKRFPDAITARDALLLITENSDFPTLSAMGSQLKLLSPPQIVVGTLGIFTISSIATWSVNFVEHQIELTLANVAIAIIAAIAISVTELGAISIAQIDAQAKPQGIILGTIIPTLLVTLSGFIWGIEEAVTIVVAIAIAEIFILAYFWWQMPAWQAKNVPLKLGCLGGAISLGISLGLGLI